MLFHPHHLQLLFKEKKQSFLKKEKGCFFILELKTWTIKDIKGHKRVPKIS